MMAYPGATSEVFCVEACTLTGESLNVECSGNMLGKDFWLLLVAQKVPLGSPKTLKVLIGGEILKSEVSLTEQGLCDGAMVTLICTDITNAMQEAAATKMLDGDEVTVEEIHAWHSINVLARVRTLPFFNKPLPRSLQTLTSDGSFTQCFENVDLPAGLQSITFGDDFDQSMKNIGLPAGLQSLTFGKSFNQSMENVALPAGLQTLTFDESFDQSMENVALPAGLQSLTFGRCFNQSMENVALPAGLQSLIFDLEYYRSMKYVALPESCTVHFT